MAATQGPRDQYLSTHCCCSGFKWRWRCSITQHHQHHPTTVINVATKSVIKHDSGKASALTCPDISAARRPRRLPQSTHIAPAIRRATKLNAHVRASGGWRTSIAAVLSQVVVGRPLLLPSHSDYRCRLPPCISIRNVSTAGVLVPLVLSESQ
jgi:hypothetical protein